MVGDHAASIAAQAAVSFLSRYRALRAKSTLIGEPTRCREKAVFQGKALDKGHSPF